MPRAWDRTPALGGGSGEYNQGVRFTVVTAVDVLGVSFYRTSSGPATVDITLYDTATTSVLATETGVAISGTGWKDLPFDAPYAAGIGDELTAAYHITSGEHVYDSSGMPATSPDGLLELDTGCLQSGSIAFPASDWGGCHGVAVYYQEASAGAELTFDVPGPVGELAATVVGGRDLQFDAAGPVGELAMSLGAVVPAELSFDVAGPVGGLGVTLAGPATDLLSVTRDALATVLDGCSGVTGRRYQPSVLREGDAWPLLPDGLELIHGLVWQATWTIVVMLPQDDRKSVTWVDDHAMEILAALRAYGTAFPTAAGPALLGPNDIKVLQITLTTVG